MATRKPKSVDTPAAESAETKKPRRTAAKAATAGETPAAPKRVRKPKAEAPVAESTVAENAGGTRTHEERHRHIQEAAYYIAEKRGFTPGSEHDDWLQAEQEVDTPNQG